MEAKDLAKETGGKVQKTVGNARDERKDLRWRHSFMRTEGRDHVAPLHFQVSATISSSPCCSRSNLRKS